mmetsp:Transcript_9673/g.26341  ORF Transcript_9673/g.26341 Transcript_9673/m.26341 type:complete len:159 (+) Transcript_9673:2170-2646(+)
MYSNCTSSWMSQPAQSLPTDEFVASHGRSSQSSIRQEERSEGVRKRGRNRLFSLIHKATYHGVCGTDTPTNPGLCSDLPSLLLCAAKKVLAMRVAAQGIRSTTMSGDVVAGNDADKADAKRALCGRWRRSVTREKCDVLFAACAGMRSVTARGANNQG